MRFFTSSIVPIALYATSVYGKCFNTGENWGDHGVAKAELHEACIELQGPYSPRQVAALCRNSPSSDKSFIFEMENLSSENAEISQDECERNIGAQIDNCGHGGEISHSGTRFRYVSYMYNKSWCLRDWPLIADFFLKKKGGSE